jgi:AraC-like DNA-binding protein
MAKIKDKYRQGSGGHVEKADYFYFETSPFYNKELAVVCGGMEKCAGDFRIERPNYPYYFVKLTVGGRGLLETDSGVYELCAGTLSGFCPRRRHRYVSDADEPMEHMFVTFAGYEADELMRISGLTEKNSLQTEGTGEIMRRILAIGLDKPAYSQKMICSYLRILLCGEAARYSASRYAAASEVTFRRCKRFIDGNFSQVSSAGQAAERCGVNVRYMSALFKRYNMMTPQSYIMRLKLNKAADMLLASDRSVKEIAGRVGFIDPYHFSRNFKRFYEISPTEYRGKYLGGE